MSECMSCLHVKMNVKCMSDLCMSKCMYECMSSKKYPLRGCYFEWRKLPLLQVQKIGRNELCPCGSGLKWKKCTCSQYHSN